MFRWAVSQEIVDESVWTRLKSLWGLRRGEAKESQPVLPVEQERIEGIREACSPTLWAMIQVQLLTGARPGEICSMRQGELSMQGEIWEYRPSSWKTQQYGGQKVILLGPKAQEAIRPFLRTSIEAFLFSPIESKQWHNARRSSLHGASRRIRSTADTAMCMPRREAAARLAPAVKRDGPRE